jgi:hypothetical protein
MTLTAERVRELLDYDPQTGALTWKIARGRRFKPGAPAGAISEHARQIRVDGRNYKEHRIVWLHVHGRWPVADIDHKDGNPRNNAIDNLREATRTQNNANRRGQGRTGLPKGVHFCGRTGRYVAQITCGGRNTFLGRFNTPEHAHAAYAVAAEKHFGEFARLK